VLCNAREYGGKIVNATLHIDEVSGVQYDFVLQYPKIHSESAINVKDLFERITPYEINSFKIFGEQYDSDLLWRIELWGNSGIQNPTIHCGTIDGLPDDGWIGQQETP
jgi:hypothetical protein